MTLRTNPWLRLALALCCACWLAAPARPGAAQPSSPVFPPETVLLPWRTIRDITAQAVDAGRLVWFDYTNQLWLIDIQSRQRRSLGPVGGRPHTPRLSGDMVVWFEVERDRLSGQPQTDRLRGISLRDGGSFMITPAADEITALTVSPEQVVWARQVGPNSQILSQRLPPQGEPTLLAEAGGARVTQLALNGAELSWLELRESAPGSAVFSSLVRALDSAAGAAPSTLVTVDGRVQRYIRVPGGLAWSVASSARRQRLFLLDQRGAPLLLAEDVIAFEPFGAEVTVTSDQNTAAYDLRSGARRGITALSARSRLALDADAVCWDGQAEPVHLQCYSRSRNAVFETPPPGTLVFMHISAGTLLLGARSADPQDPITVYAQPMEQLFQRATPMSPQLPAPEAAAFDRLWQRQDLLVQQGRASRSWTWGPQPISQDLHELYAEGADGTRTVRYYDKSRMEVNNPQADPDSPWYITNGLLPVELISGRLQTGNQSFEQRPPAAVTAVGDPGQFPTYADLAALFQSPGPADPAQQGRPVTRLLTPDGAPAALADFARDPATLAVSLSNGHPVPRAFADFMAQRGPTWQDGRAGSGPLYDPLFVFGLPVTPPVWVLVRVGGQTRPVLFQVFERRVLTYTPANPPGFRVEMGNVGQHYFQWRYP